MIAVPVDSAEVNERISVYFGEAAYFSLYSTRGSFVQTLVNQEPGSGQRLSRFLAEQRVNQVVFQQMGDKLFGWLQREGIEAFALISTSLSIDRVLRSVRERTLKRVTDASVGSLLHPAGPRKGSNCD